MFAGLTPLVHALADYQRGDHDATILVWRDDGLAEPLPAAHFFRTPGDFSALEHQALALCRGSVLDTEALAGAHSLALQSRGRRVCGLTFHDDAAAVLGARGLLEPLACSLTALDGRRFDTILRLNPGIGLADSEAGVGQFLQTCRRLVAAQGRLILYSRDPSRHKSPLYSLYALLNRSAGRPVGEVRLQLEYRGERGALFRWLHVEAERLAALSAVHGWQCTIAAEDGRGDYVAKLTPA